MRLPCELCPGKKVYPAVFPDEEWTVSFDPLTDGPTLVQAIDCDGLLIDTFNKNIGKGLLDYYDTVELSKFVDQLHDLGKEGLQVDQLHDLGKEGLQEASRKKNLQNSGLPVLM